LFPKLAMSPDGVMATIRTMLYIFVDLPNPCEKEHPVWNTRPCRPLGLTMRRPHNPHPR
jgi:hypothetical protein